jgi:hypothetical protein
MTGLVARRPGVLDSWKAGVNTNAALIEHENCLKAHFFEDIHELPPLNLEFVLGAVEKARIRKIVVILV